EIPSARVGRFIKLPEADGKNFVILIDDVIQLFLPQLFSGYEIESSYNVKLTRDAELYIDDEFTGNLLDKIKKSLSKRNTGVPCRFLYDSKMPKDFLKFLRNCIRLNKDDLIPGGKYHNFNDFFSFPEFNSDNSQENKLKYESFPALRSKIFDGYSSVFETVSRQDILIHFPYQSYDYVINFLNEAADDPEVK